MTEASRQGDKLLAEAKAQQAANRASLLRSQQEQGDLGAIGRLGGLAQIKTAVAAIGGITLYATGDPPRRRPEPFTPVIAKNIFNILWLAQKRTSSQTAMKLFSGNTGAFQDSIFDLLSMPPVPSVGFLPSRYGKSDVNISVFPINKKSSIVILSFVSVTSSTHFKTVDDVFIPGDGDFGEVPSSVIFPLTVVVDSSDSKTEKHVFYVDQQTIKEISIPTAVEAVIDPSIYLPTGEFILNDYPSRADFTFIHAAAYDLGYACAKFDDIKTGFFFDDPTINFYRVAGPGSFALFSNPTAAIAIGDFTPSPLEDVWQQDLIYDFINSLILPLNTLSISSTNLNGAVAVDYIGVYPPIGRSPVFGPIDGFDNPVWSRVGKNEQMAKRPTNPFTDLLAGEFSEMIPIFYWDWNEPAYCREQLLALGFTEADLTP